MDSVENHQRRDRPTQERQDGVGGGSGRCVGPIHEKGEVVHSEAAKSRCESKAVRRRPTSLVVDPAGDAERGTVARWRGDVDGLTKGCLDGSYRICLTIVQRHISNAYSNLSSSVVQGRLKLSPSTLRSWGPCCTGKRHVIC